MPCLVFWAGATSSFLWKVIFIFSGNVLSARTLSALTGTLTSLCRGIHLPCVQGLRVSSGLDWHFRCPCLQLGLWCHLLDGPQTWVLGRIPLALSLASIFCMDPGSSSPYAELLVSMTPASGFAHTLQVHEDYAELLRTWAWSSPAHCWYNPCDCANFGWDLPHRKLYPSNRCLT